MVLHRPVELAAFIRRYPVLPGPRNRTVMAAGVRYGTILDAPGMLG